VLTITRQGDADHLARDLRPFNTTPGYFIVSRDPILQSIHLIDRVVGKTDTLNLER
jgi:hypothetical protein